MHSQIWKFLSNMGHNSYIFWCYNILPLIFHLLCYLECLCSSLDRLKRITPILQALSLAIATALFACLFFFLYFLCASSLPTLCHLLNAIFFSLTASCTSSFYLQVSLALCFCPCCRSKDFSCRVQQYIRQTSAINIIIFLLLFYHKLSLQTFFY